MRWEGPQLQWTQPMLTISSLTGRANSMFMVEEQEINDLSPLLGDVANEIFSCA